MAPPASVAVPLLALLGSVTLQPAAAAAAADVSFPGMIAHVLQGRKTIDVSSSEWFANDGPLPTPPADHDAAAEVECGAALFTHGKVTGSIDAFDTAMSWDGRVNGTLWQRGCSMYYTEQWTEGAAQFAFNVSENPNGTEESVWRWLCQAREHGVPYATAHIMDTTGETRPYTVYGEGLRDVQGRGEQWRDCGRARCAGAVRRRLGVGLAGAAAASHH